MIPNWVDTNAIVPQPRDNEWARKRTARRQLRRHALRQRRTRAGSRHPRAGGDVSARSRGPADRHRRRSARVTRTPWSCRSGSSSTTSCASCRISRASVLSESLSSAHLHFVGLAKGLSGLRRPEPALRDPRRGAAGDRRRRRRQRDGAARLRGRVRDRASARPARAVAKAIREAHDGMHDLEAMGAKRRACTSSSRPTATSPSGATGS